ncbi:MAG: metal ABC transporter substrate-binding protein [Tepidiformaceae bacterium]
MVATTVQIGALAREVGGNDIEVRVLIKPGIDPHDYEATAGDLKALRSARLVLRNGIGLDEFLDDAIESAEAGSRVVTVTDGIDVRETGGEPDPHVWHDPGNARVMAANIAAALGVAEPALAGAFGGRAAAYGRTLDDTAAQIEALIETVPPQNRKLVTDHDAFGYFIDRFGLTLVGTVIPGSTTQSEPSARELAALVDTIRRENVKAIFAESSLDAATARQIARDTGVRIVDDLYGDSLGEPGSGAETIHGMLLANARKIVEALK